MTPSPSRLALRTSLVYAGFGLAWIFFSDELLLTVVRDPATARRLSVAKGSAFVITTSLLLYTMLRAQLGRWTEEASKRHRAEAEARSAASHLRMLSQAMEHSTASIVITDRDGGIEYVNSRFTQLTGYTLDDVRGKNPRILQSGETPREEYSKLWSTISRGETWHGEFHNRRKDGTLYWEKATVAPIVGEGDQITHYLAVKDDVTERKDLEAQLRQSQKMEVIGTLAGGIAHDFNNLLTVILSNASLLTTPDGTGEDSQSLAQEIFDAGESAAKLTRQLLLFSRKQAIHASRLDVNDALKTLTRMLRRVVGEHVQVLTECADGPLLILADGGMFDQALMNLSVNARDAMPEGGILTLRTRAVELSEAEAAAIPGATPGAFVVVEVSDTGTGIDASVLPHIFEPFFTTKEAGRGTGLGLATVYGIARQHRGWVVAQSEVGKGTTFRLGFPAIATSPLSARPEPGKMRAGKGTVLVVEDDAPLRLSMSRTLRQCGYSVLEAATGAEALRVAGSNDGAITLLVTDLLMPDVDGVALAATMRGREPTLRVLFISGYDPAAGQVPPPGPNEPFLRKPFGASALSDAVRTALA
ncbi:MAG: PAS domain S-box protein [Polyangiales bacterium]